MAENFLDKKTAHQYTLKTWLGVDMHIDISNLLQSRGAKKRYEVTPDCRFVKVYGREYAVHFPKAMIVEVENVGDRELEIAYAAKVTVSIPCARCLEDVDYPISFSGKRKADMKLEEIQRDEAFFIVNDEIHTELLAADEILIQWPIRVLCKEDCKGLCSRCGANLNTSFCDCEEEAVDVRMAAIKDIFTQFKEV